MKGYLKVLVQSAAALLMAGALAVAAPAPQAKLAATPPMGRNRWNHFGCKVTAADVRAAADAMVSSGMKAAGYEYVNVDDCWEGHRDAQGRIQGNASFPDMKALADYIHSKGLKFGIYSSPGPKTCSGYEGSYGHVLQDAKTYAAWGVDYLKYDWCSGSKVYKPSQMPEVYKQMHEALVSTGRPIVYSISNCGMHSAWEWAASVGANLWRTTGNIAPNYCRMYFIAHSEDGIEPFAGPGHWNDPDALEVGNKGMTYDEQVSQMSMWCMMASPLLAGNDLTHMSAQTHSILTNREVIAVDQDPKGEQGRWVWQIGPYEIWAKPLADGSVAALLINRGVDAARITAQFKDLGTSGTKHVRDLWQHKELGEFTNSFSAEVPPNGVVMVKVY